jgi:hypothetical protein
MVSSVGSGARTYRAAPALGARALRVAGRSRLPDDDRVGSIRVRAAAAAVVGVALAGCAAAPAPVEPAEPVASAPAVPPATAPTPTAGDASDTVALARCGSVRKEQTVRGLIGGQPEVTGGKERVTGQVTQVRCTWFAPNGRYITIVSLDGPGLAERAETVKAGATPVPGSSGVSYDVKRGLIVTVDGRLHQIVAGGAGTAQARIIGLKTIEAIRAGG